MNHCRINFSLLLLLIDASCFTDLNQLRLRVLLPLRLLLILLRLLASGESTQLFCVLDFPSLSLKEVSPAPHNQLTIDVVLRAVNLVGVLFKFVNVNLAKSALFHLACGFKQFIDRSDVLVEG